MRRAQGFALAELAIILGILIALGALLATVRSAWEAHNDAMKEAGRAEVRAQVAKRDEAKRIEVEAERARLAKAQADKEAADAAKLKENEDAWRKKLADAKGDLDRFVADVNAGRIVWRQPGATGSGTAAGSAAVLPETQADLGTCAGLVGGGTVPSEALPLLRLACAEFARADRIRLKLSAARGELSICNGEAALPANPH